MNSHVCVNCRNENPVNRTDNRLVFERCGHMKCMNCLLQEKAGCVACQKAAPETPEEALTDDEVVNGTDSVPVQTELKESEDALQVDITKKKKQLETSHIRIESDGNGKYYVCTLCKKRFQSRSQVAYHAYCNGQSKPYTCVPCTKSFASQSHYKYHMRVHRNERAYPCDVCGQAFFQMSKLQRHKLKHTKEKMHACSQCNKAFNNLTALRKHGLTHTEERPYTCNTCGRRFRDGSNFKKHVMKHNNLKKCTCVLCGRERCGGRCAARRHQCARCPQAFHSSKDLRRHAAVHTDSKPFRCKVCERNFRRKDNLERHIRNTHPDYVTATAVECDETALKQITTNGHTDNNIEQKIDENEEKIKLEIMNPLPPLPKEVIENLSSEKPSKNDKVTPVIDKSYILFANNARQSVIVGKRSSAIDKPPESPECEYVHKIRKANSLASQKNISLPPIDERKMAELQIQTNLNKLGVVAPPKDKAKYEKILCEDAEVKETELSAEVSPQVHWRKMKLNCN